MSAEFEKIKTGENAAMLEAIDSGCALIENWFGNAMHRGHDFLMGDPTKVAAQTIQITPYDRQKIAEDERTLDGDLDKYMNALQDLVELVETYGPTQYNRIASSERFRKACAEGRRLDSLRKNPMIESIVAGRQFAAMLESAAKRMDRDSAVKVGQIFLEANARATLAMSEGKLAAYEIAFEDVWTENVKVTYRPDFDSYIIDADISFAGNGHGPDWSIVDTLGDTPRYTGHINLTIPDRQIKWADCATLTDTGFGAGIQQKLEELEQAFQNLSISDYKSQSAWTENKFDPSKFGGANVFIDFTNSAARVDFADGGPCKMKLEIDPSFSEDVGDAFEGDVEPFGEAVMAPAKSALNDVIGESVASSFQTVMNIIADFISRHGIYTWDDFQRTEKWRNAYSHGGQRVAVAN